jgi:GT2 family glycosyltransferase
MGEQTGKADGPYVVAVVLTWKDTEMTTRCVRSLLDATHPNTGIVVVDNGSDPPGCPIVAEQFPMIEPVQLDRNQGFTGGCNRGIERALELDADYVFLLNNDTIVHKDAIAHLVAAMETRPDAAMASAVLLLPGDEQKIQFYRGDMRRDCALHFHPGEGEQLSDKHRATIETEFAPACAVLFRPEALRQVGLFDESLFTNWEDYDLCCRFHDAGWKLITVGDAEVIHAHGQTTGRISPFITYFFTRNRLICLFRHARMGAILRNALTIVRSFKWQIQEYGYTNWPAHRALLKGLLHFLLGRRGEGDAPSDRQDRAGN